MCPAIMYTVATKLFHTTHLDFLAWFTFFFPDNLQAVID